MLTYAEIPGIYIIPEEKKLICIDHIEAQILSTGDSTIKLKLSNNTKYDASVRLMNESPGERLKPLPQNYLLNSMTIELKAGEVKQIDIEHK